MGRPKKPRSLVLTGPMLDHIAAWCDEPGNVGVDAFGQARIWIRVDLVRALVAGARFGRGLATIAAQSPEQRRAVAKRAVAARWARPDARARQSMATAEQWRRKRARNSTEPDDRATPHDTARRKSASDGP